MRSGRLAPKGVCQRCGLEYPLARLKKEWTGLRVCSDDFDPRPAELKAPKYKPEGLILPNASPEPEPVFGRASRSDL
jgi:hypothetical protein